MERDVVFCIAPGVKRPELQYALRSLTMIPHRRVFFIGGMPDWVVDVEHVPLPQKGKWQDLTRMWDLIPTMDLTPEFIYTEDDYFILKPVTDIPNYHAKRELKNKVDWNKKYPRGSIPFTWAGSLRATYDLLVANGIKHPLSFDVHIPMIVEKDRIPHAWDPGNIPLRYRDLIGNTATREPVEIIRDVKCSTLNNTAAVLDLDLGFLSSSDQTFVKAGVETALRGVHPEPCRYEQEFYMESSSFEPASAYDEPFDPPRISKAAAIKARIVERYVPRNGPIRVKLDSGSWVDEDTLDEEE